MSEQNKLLAYTVEHCPGVDIPDKRGREKTEDYYRVRKLDMERGYIIPAMSGYPPSEKEPPCSNCARSSLNEFLDLRDFFLSEIFFLD